MGCDTSQPFVTPTSRDMVFRFLIAYKRDHDGNAPTLREIAQACCLARATVKYHLLLLEKEGRIRWQGGRAIEIRGGSWEFAETA